MTCLLIIILLSLWTFKLANAWYNVPSLLKNNYYAPEFRMTPFSINLQDSVYSFSYENSASSHPTQLPLVVCVTDFSDAISETTFLYEKSVINFLKSKFDQQNATYLVIASKISSEVTTVKNALLQHAKVLGIDEKKILSHFLFANDTVSELTDTTLLPSILNQFNTYTSRVSIQVDGTDQLFNISRADAVWPTAPSPPSSSLVLFDGGNGCQTLVSPTNAQGKYVIVSADSCPAESAALRAYEAGAAAVLIINKKGQSGYTPLNFDLTGYTPIAAATISYNDGMNLKKLLSESTPDSVTGTNYYVNIPGYFFIVDYVGRLQQIGMNGYQDRPDLTAASWANQYEVYRQSIANKLNLPGYAAVAIQDSVVGTGAVPVTIPSKVLKSYGKLSIETAITCPGNADPTYCSGWDHVISLQVKCLSSPSAYTPTTGHSSSSSAIISDGPVIEAPLSKVPKSQQTHTKDSLIRRQAFQSTIASDNHFSSSKHSGYDKAIKKVRLSEVGGYSDEIARYITPYTRRIGKWITDSDILLAIIANEESCSSFVIDANAGGYPYFLSVTIRLSDYGVAPPIGQTLLYSIQEQTLNSLYNVNRTQSILVPKDSSRTMLQVIATGHGSDGNTQCCEFLPTYHIFTINGDSYNFTFSEAGSEFGCAEQVNLGAEPNQYGTWWYGRNGWCPGKDVTPWQVDVSKSIISGRPNVVNYKCLMYDLNTNTYVEPPAGDSGYIILSSHFIYYSDTMTASADSSKDSSSSSSSATLPSSTSSSQEDHTKHEFLVSRKYTVDSSTIVSASDEEDAERVAAVGVRVGGDVIKTSSDISGMQTVVNELK